MGRNPCKDVISVTNILKFKSHVACNLSEFVDEFVLNVNHISYLVCVYISIVIKRVRRICLCNLIKYRVLIGTRGQTKV